MNQQYKEPYYYLLKSKADAQIRLLEILIDTSDSRVEIVCFALKGQKTYSLQSQISDVLGCLK
jgi:hypothetical protein